MTEQEKFQKSDGEIPFINQIDRGFRSSLAAWKSGQFILQPNFMNSDGKFATGEVLRSASIAADRSGNERAVGVAKMSSYVKRGLKTHTQTLSVSQMYGWRGASRQTSCSDRFCKPKKYMRR